MNRLLKNVFLLHVFLLSSLQAPLWAKQSNRYIVNPLVSNQSGVAFQTDPHLINPWGLVFDSSGNLVVADNGSNLSTSYTPNGIIRGFIINVLTKPTGLVRNHSDDDFLLGNKPSKYIYSTLTGMILAFNKEIDPLNALIMVNRASLNTVYTGVTIAEHEGKTFLYAADFHNRKIDVFNDEFTFIKSFNDLSIPAAFSPFNIQNINNQLFVTYAMQLPPANVQTLAASGAGYVVVFKSSGEVIKALISNSVLNAPWGLTLAPSSFGKFSGALLVGNFGDGHINAFNPCSGKFLGQLDDLNGNPITINGLWSLKFNHSNILYFTSGPNNETNGLIGAIAHFE